jgi:ferredoxin
LVRMDLVEDPSLSQAAARIFRVTLLTPRGEHAIVVAPGQHIWDAAQAAGIILPALCHQGRCLTCAGRLEGPGEVDQSDSDAYFPQDREAGFALLCTGKARSDLRIRTHQQHEMRTYRRSLGLPAPYS